MIIIHTLKKYKWEIVSALVCLTLGMLSGAYANMPNTKGSLSHIFTYTKPDELVWYNTLNRPWFQPPAWVFGPVWTILYIMLGIGLKRIIDSKHSLLLVLFIAQFALNLLWSPVFFRLHLIKESFFIIISLWLLAMLIIYISRKQKNIMLMFVPYICWISFASVINYYIWILN